MRGSAAGWPGRPSKGFDRAEQRGQVQAFDKTPDRTHAMILRHEFLQADRTPLDLAPFRRAKPRHRLANPLRRSLRSQRFEKLLVLVAIGRPAKNQIPLMDSTRWKPASPPKTCRKDFQPLRS